jgi:hypothetical protein
LFFYSHSKFSSFRGSVPETLLGGVPHLAKHERDKSLSKFVDVIPMQQIRLLADNVSRRFALERGEVLANIYLHYVLDLWAEQWRGREAQGAT